MFWENYPLSNDLPGVIFFWVDVFFHFSGFLTTPPFRRLLLNLGRQCQIWFAGAFLRDGFTASCLWCWWFWWPCLLLSWFVTLCCWNWWLIVGVLGFKDQLLRNVNKELWIPVHSASLVHNWASCWGSLLYPLGLSGLVLIETFKI